jgi:EAL domain-containing protein (putative c-di-GMP-specific phosphodiesterase class I)
MFDEFDLSIRTAIHNLLLVLYEQGITEVHTGGLMRILGVSNEAAQQHDDERLVLDQEFVKYVEQINTPRPVDQILH